MNAVYAPGTVAVISADFGEVGFTGERGLRIEHGWATAHGETVDRYVTDISPLVVIDPEDRAQVERLVVAHCRAYCCDPAPLQPEEVAIMQAALREFANPKHPKPEEPQGLGAVVEDADGSLLVRIDHPLQPWTCHGGPRWSWDDVDAVRVLSEGVQ